MKDRASPMKELSSSTEPYAPTLFAYFGILLPFPRAVEPSSPVLVYILFKMTITDSFNN
jgi:hypothetical protein